MTDAEIAAAIEKLDQALAGASVIQTLTVGGTTFTFRTPEDIKQGRAALAQLLSTSRSRPSRLAIISKGL